MSPGVSSVGPRVVAEIGTAHGGDPERARALIAAARDAGADTAKFQIVRADEILHPATGSVELPGGPVSLYDRFRELERDESFFRQVREMCAERDIRFLCTPFGIGTARTLHRLDVDEFKIASPELNHLPLLREIAGYHRPVVLSAGVATIGDIAEALAVFPIASSLTVLQCVTSYPAPEEDYNLRVIPALRSAFGVPVGVSDHSLDPLLVPAVATALGASMVEKHITLSRRDNGLDDAIALEPKAFASMSAEVRRIAGALREAGPPESSTYRRRQTEILAELAKRFGSDRVERVLGDGVKRVAVSEERNYGYTNRSIHARRDLSTGHVVTSDDIAILRTEKNLTAGLHPRYWDTVLGATLTRPIEAGAGLLWNHLLLRQED